MCGHVSCRVMVEEWTTTSLLMATSHGECMVMVEGVINNVVVDGNKSWRLQHGSGAKCSSW